MMMPATVALQIIEMLPAFHDKMNHLSTLAREGGNDDLAQQIADCKLDFANRITAIVLQLQLIGNAGTEKEVGM
jgi:hypothetical protein